MCCFCFAIVQAAWHDAVVSAKVCVVVVVVGGVAVAAVVVVVGQIVCKHGIGVGAVVAMAFVDVVVQRHQLHRQQ